MRNALKPRSKVRDLWSAELTPQALRRRESGVEPLAALHGQPATAWTVESLARALAVSRSVLPDRFTEMVGRLPMQYLALWRMQLASRRLLEGEAVGEVAVGVGYESEAAFSGAFKKLVGEAPSPWRRANVTCVPQIRHGADYRSQHPVPRAVAGADGLSPRLNAPAS